MASDATESASWIVSNGAFAKMLAGYMYEPHLGCSRICTRVVRRQLAGDYHASMCWHQSDTVRRRCAPCSIQHWMSCSPAAC
jgi:hypothetical protein